MPARPPGPIAKFIATLLGIVLLIAGLMFSVFALAVVAIGGIALWGWLWWKTRSLRKAMAAAAATGAGPSTHEAGGQIIDGEVIRVDEPQRRPQPLS